MLRILQIVFLVVIVVLMLPLIVVGCVSYAVWAGGLYGLVWTWWLGQSAQRVVFVYSDSPNWKDHIEGGILPRLPADAVILNWSRRREWRRFSFPALLFRTFAGGREFLGHNGHVDVPRPASWTEEQRAWALHSEALWARAHRIARARPHLDAADIYHALRCLELAPAERLRRGLGRGRLRARAR